MAHLFDTLTVADISASLVLTPVQVRVTDNVISTPFPGDVIARVDGTTATVRRQTWLLRVVEVILTASTRRPFIVQAATSLHALQGHALVRITVDGHTTSRQIRAGGSPRALDASLRLAIRCSAHPRDRLRVMLWVEKRRT